jgi:raffinose/stachyose/melibiose transport system substrate-binding protein
MKHSRRKILPILVASALLAAACGGDDDDSAGDDATTDDAATDDAATDDAATDDAATDDAATDDAATDDAAGDDAGALEGTLRVLIHQNPPMVEWVENFNADFEAANPGVTIDMSIVNADDIPTINNTRLSAKDIDVTTLTVTGLANPVQPYMEGVEPPYWQTLIEAGLLMDLSDQPFVQNYDQAAIEEGGSFDGKVYSLNLGRVTYSGMFVNLDLLAEVGVEVPTTWSELVAACEAVKDAGFQCMTAGGADSWPIFVGSYGLLGALYPDQEGLVEGLWTGSLAWNDEQGQTLFERYATYANDMLEEQAGALGHDAAIERYKAGDVAFAPTGNWQAGVMEPPEGSDLTPATFEWTYIPFPGSDSAADNQTLFGKYDQGWAVAADTEVPDLALAYLAAFSEPETYNSFANAVNFLPTQPTATLDNTLGRAVAPILQEGNFTVGYEQWWVSPTAAGSLANGAAAAQWFFDGTLSDPVTGADTVQADLAAGLG